MSERSLNDVLRFCCERLVDRSAAGKGELDSAVVGRAFGVDSSPYDDLLVNGKSVDLEGDCVVGQGGELYDVL